MGWNVAAVVFAALVAALIALPTPAVMPQSPPIVMAQLTRQGPPAAARLEASCAQQTWPNLDNSCLRYADDTPSTRAIRRIGGDHR